MGAAPGPEGAGSLRKDSKVAVAKEQAVGAGRRQVTMKGLYFQQSSTNEEITFVFQERVKRRTSSVVSTAAWPRFCREFSRESGFEVSYPVILVDHQNVPEVLGLFSRLEAKYHSFNQMMKSLEFYPWILRTLDFVKLSEYMSITWALGTIAIQLAHHRGARVISTACSLEDKQYLERLRPSLARVIDLSNGKAHVAESCLEETGGLGVDIVLDAGVRLYSKDDEPAVKLQPLPHKHDIITLLGVGGHWVTTEENLQLDPPDSHCLFLKGATVAFLNDEVWNLSNVQQGKYLCILKDVMEKLSAGVFRPQLDEPIPLYEAKVSMEVVQKNQGRKKQVVQF
ncbi:quinone oxidoreductase-like protein 1 isoform X7 [Equus przewalskii]|uniref:Quinone oxidoreductase-like protein 1 isoform X7 n=1 Tax=Equus przewalskii TaxID=9798 RepID=A0ABM4MKT6_EQUPR